MAAGGGGLVLVLLSRGRSAAAASSRAALSASRSAWVGVFVGVSVGIVGARRVFVGVFAVSVGVSFGVSVGVSVGVSAPFVSASDSDAFAAASSARAPSDSLVAASASFDSLSSPTTPFTHCFHPPDSGFASTVGEGGFEDVASPAARSTGSTKDASAAATPSFAVVSVEFAVDVFLGTLSAASAGSSVSPRRRRRSPNPRTSSRHRSPSSGTSLRTRSDRRRRSIVRARRG